MGKTIVEYFGMKPIKVISALKRTFDTFPVPGDPIESEVLVGIEVEVENAQDTSTPNSGAWIPTADGSLRNGGVEFISQPMPAKYAPHILQELLQDTLKKDSCFSPRTSIHVHLNMQDLATEKVVDIILLYACIEPLLYKFTGRGRAKNIYCVPLFDTNLLTFMATEDLVTSTEKWSKYTGLNILPLRDKGTLEFRQMHGTFDHHKVAIWVRLLTKLVEFCKATETGTIRKTVLGLSKATDMSILISQIFGQDSQYLKFESWEDVKHAVGNVRSAFAKPATLNALIPERLADSAYFVKTRG